MWPGLLSAIGGPDEMSSTGSRTMDAVDIASGESRLIGHLISPKARDLYHALKASRTAERLGVHADVGIGYVTGANDFFHLSPAEARQWRIPEEFLKPAIRRGRALTGLRFTDRDWRRAVETKQAGYLLHICKDAPLPQSVRGYLDQGEAKGIAKAYKCRTRSPWYSVPHVYRPDAFLTYMSGLTPRLVSNDTEAVAPNTLHILRLHDHHAMTGQALSVLWQTSLTRLSVEIEGHALGGGMLKLEPTEAENVLIAKARSSRVSALAEELDHLARERGEGAARERADQVILQDLLGMSASECELLRSATTTLRARRGYRDSAHGLA
jgi:hypothetical protein